MFSFTIEDREDFLNSPATMQSTVLLVEDEILIRLEVADTLRGAGYRVIEAADGAEGRALIETSPDLDLVISDIRMPGTIDGLELARWAKAQRPSLPVLVVSSLPPTEQTTSIDRFLEKPVSASDLLRTVGELIGTEWNNGNTTKIAS